MLLLGRILLLLFGLALIAGGGVGYAKSDSTASLVAGAATGLVILGAFILSLKKPKTGALLGAAASAAVAIMMGQRFLEKWEGDGTFMQKFMPSGMIAVLSLAMIVICFAMLGSKKKAPKK